MYHIIQPPFNLKFQEMSKKELKNYKDWFHQIMPTRLEILIGAIKSTEGYENWEPNRSPESLDALGAWFLQEAQTRLRSQEEMDGIQSSFPIYVPDQELTNKTFSLAVDIGMYLSQVFLKQYPSLRWSQPLNNKKFVDYGEPVLDGFGKISFNPVGMMVTHAYALMRGSRNAASLRKVYDYWATLARGEKPSIDSGIREGGKGKRGQVHLWA